MTSRPVLIPGTDHPIAVTLSDAHVVVTVAGEVIADTRRALRLQEASYPAVWYVPREDADMSRLRRSDHATYCPYKGDAAYFSIPDGGPRSFNAVWSYETPHESVAPIEGHLAFYPDRVDAITVS